MDIRYDINKTELQDNGYYVTYGFLKIDYDFVFGIWPAISGMYGRGTIPIGQYKIEAPIVLDDTEENKAYKKEGHPWYVKLTPIGKCADGNGERTGLCIHPDGNTDGTLGCIGITEHDLSAYQMLNYLTKAKKGDVILNVC